jgi:hypothetical protein
MDIPGVNIVSASFNGSDALAFGIGITPLGYHFPTSGNNFAILSTGWAQAAEWPNSQSNLSFGLNGLNNAQGNDMAQLSLELAVPANANCASFDFAFYSEEFPEYVGSQYNDTFTAELGGTSLTISGTQVFAPLNFAFDVGNRIISINTVSGVSAPTNTTYDGKTPLRRAKTPVAPGQIARIVFTVQDLGDSAWDSTVLVDNFAFTYDPACNPGVKPPVNPQGNLQLHMSADVDTGVPIRPAVTVLNQSNAPVAYNVNVQLWRGLAMQVQRIIPVQFTTSGSQQVSVDFGVYPPDKYYIRAELRQGQELLQTEQQIFYVGYAYLKLNSATSNLTAAAHIELNESREIAVDVLTLATQAGADDIADFIIGKVLAILPGFAETFGTNAETMGSAIHQLSSDISRIKEALQQATYSKIADVHRYGLDAQTFSKRNQSVQTQEANLVEYAHGRQFLWNVGWQGEIQKFRTAIENKNETDQSGFWPQVELIPPSARQATLVEMRGLFDLWLNEILPFWDDLAKYALYALAATLLTVLVVKMILLIIGSGGLALPIVGVLLPIMKGVVAVLELEKALNTLFAMLLATAISTSAQYAISPNIVRGHSLGMDWLKDRVDGKPLPAQISDLYLTTDVQGRSVRAQTSVNTVGGIALANTQLFRADGRLMDIAPYSEVQNGEKTNYQVTLQPGSYWMVGVAHSDKGVAAKRTIFGVANPQVELSLFLNKTGFVLGETVKATVVVRNLDVGQSTGTLSLGVGTLDGEGLQLWTPSLDAGQSATYEYAGFVPQQEGGYVLRASIGNESGPIARVDRAFAVGNSAAVQLNVSPQTVYPPGASVTWNVEAFNAGNQPTTTVITLNTYDLNNKYALIGTSNYPLTLNAQASEALSVPVLQPAQPGSYSTHMEVNGRIYRTDNYLVSADGALFAIVQAEPNVIALGQQVAITIEVQNEIYSPIDAEVMLTMISPDGQSLTPPLQQITTGIYRTTYSPSITGTFQVDVSVAKSNYAGNTSSTYVICQDASLLLTAVQGQLTLDEMVAMTLTVQNERGTPVRNATVAVSDTQGSLVAFTDQDGRATFALEAADTIPRQVRVEKGGFASTSLQLPVKDSVGSRAPALILSAPSVTNQPNLAIYGKTDVGANVSIQGKSAPVSSKGSFSTSVQLVEGANNISALATNATGLSTAITKVVTLDTTPPTLTIDVPSLDHATTTPFVTFVGSVEPGAALFVDGRIVNVQPDGSYSITVILGAIGKSTITLTAIDASGNENVKQRTVTRLSVNHLPLVRRK